MDDYELFNNNDSDRYFCGYNTGLEAFGYMLSLERLGQDSDIDIEEAKQRLMKFGRLLKNIDQMPYTCSLGRKMLREIGNELKEHYFESSTPILTSWSAEYEREVKLSNERILNLKKHPQMQELKLKGVRSLDDLADTFMKVDNDEFFKPYVPLLTSMFEFMKEDCKQYLFYFGPWGLQNAV